MSQERILCSAIHYLTNKTEEHQPFNIETGFVLCGLRHHNIITNYFILTGKPTLRSESISGFLTSENRFVDRKEGAIIALNAGQVCEDGMHIVGKLFSEDLY